jgi:geranylgeranyl pyrophosphate synthase
MYKTIHQIQSGCRKYQEFMKLGFQGPRLLSLLNRAVQEHQQVEDLFAERIKQSRCGSGVIFPYRHLSKPLYFERNFFSILFLSIFISLDIPLNRRIRYGVILHCLRTIVTSADNILDQEKNGAVLLEENRSNPVLKNILLTLMSQTVICQTIREMVDTAAEAGRIESTLLDCMDSIAAGESMTSMQGRDEIPSPDELIRNVHEKIGGELLRLALVVPLEIEVTLREPLQLMEKGILAIGVALQMLDDVVDLEEDLHAEKTNLLASWIVHQVHEMTWPQLHELEASGQFPAERFERLRMDLINAAIEKALGGFDYLAQTGYPVKRNQARSILKIMFRLRGLEKEWNESAYV